MLAGLGIHTDVLLLCWVFKTYSLRDTLPNYRPCQRQILKHAGRYLILAQQDHGTGP